ncbi:phosphate/phosphite/phosphonate ABC transporter substrate-binding protein [Neptunomonas antarctica]|uniref:Phosphonate transport system substrate-binding protein n=1 Tax=Neptunomonas antarctica TaxID=619304 RepID=A0A1N7NMU3_9GAMM|nr:phosphate/phosphite/phosphonate ABC transporter substrate-binding protein [Neptunomonas antarctica]SIS99753.1 phosphonate transport system substrate-binding protein [Neptunomonas antarctica]
MRTIFVALMVSTILLGAPAVNADTRLSFGVVPQQSANKSAKIWTPILNYLGAKMGKNIRFATARDIPTFEERLLAGQYDIAYMNPYHYTVFHNTPGYEAIARQKNQRVNGIMIVRKDSPIQELAELNNRKLAFPSPTAFAASVIPRSVMKWQNIHFTPQYVSSHDSVYLGVARGFFVAGGGIMRTFNNTTPEVREQLRVLWASPGYTPHAIAVHPRVSAETVEELKHALLGMNDDPKGLALLKTMKFQGIELANDSDWDDIRALNIKLLDELIK